MRVKGDIPGQTKLLADRRAQCLVGSDVPHALDHPHYTMTTIEKKENTVLPTKMSNEELGEYVAKEGTMTKHIATIKITLRDKNMWDGVLERISDLGFDHGAEMFDVNIN